MNLWFAAVHPLIQLAEDEQFNPDTVTPGVIGFAVTAVLALAIIFLGLDLNRRLRRDRVRSEIHEKLAAEQAELAAQAQQAAGDTPAAGSPTRD